MESFRQFSIDSDNWFWKFISKVYIATYFQYAATLVPLKSVYIKPYPPPESFILLFPYLKIDTIIAEGNM